MNRELPADLLGAVCPTPIFNHKQIVLGHGSGGKLTSDLIQKVFLPAFANDYLSRLDDQASYRSTDRGLPSPPMPLS